MRGHWTASERPRARVSEARVFIADWDVHHGNGTQWILYDDPSVFYFSTHQWPHYPGTGMASDVGVGHVRTLASAPEEETPFRFVKISTNEVEPLRRVSYRADSV